MTLYYVEVSWLAHVGGLKTGLSDVLWISQVGGGKIGVCVNLFIEQGGLLQKTIEDGWICDFSRAVSLPSPDLFYCFIGEVPL